MRHVLLGLSLLALSAPLLAAQSRPHGTNCLLSAPPASAGEIETNASNWRVYPRAEDISDGYVGCQTVWAPTTDGRWEIVDVAVIEHRREVGIWPAPPDGTDSQGCRFQAGRITGGDSDTCAALVKSLPAGCLWRKYRLGKTPTDCSED